MVAWAVEHEHFVARERNRRLHLLNPGIVDRARNVAFGVGFFGLGINELEAGVVIVHHLLNVGGSDELGRGSGHRCGIVKSGLCIVLSHGIFRCQRKKSCRQGSDREPFS